MIRLIARYRIKEGTLDKGLTAIRKFVSAVAQAEPETEYRSYRLADSREFLHVMAFRDRAAQTQHQKAGYTLEFVEALYPNCEEDPTFTPIELIQ